MGTFDISRKLALGFACVLTSAAGMAVTVFFATQAVDTAAKINSAAHSTVIDIERAAAAQYDQAHTARGYIITQVERHAQLYAAATELFDRELAAARHDAADNAGTLAAITKVEAANRAWRKEIGDPEIKFSSDPKTVDKAVEIARSPYSSQMMQGFRDALQEARETIGIWSQSAAQSQASATNINRMTLIIGSLFSLTLAVLVNIWLARSIAQPARHMTALMKRLASGDNDIELPTAQRSDEFGAMADAVGAFKMAALDRLRLEAEANQHRSLAEQERTARMAESEAVNRVRQQVFDMLGDGMERLASGDLVHRVDFRFGVPRDRQAR